MADVYTRERIIELLTKYFEEQGYKCTPYPDIRGEVRLPLRCVRDKDKEEEEILLDIITEKSISKDTHLPDEKVNQAEILNASLVRFLQYYLPRAKIFCAYGYYVDKDEGFEEFVRACADSGIGLLEVSDRKVDIVQYPIPLNKIVSDKAKKISDKMPISRALKERITKELTEILESQQEEYIHYLVYYADPQFRRREIVGRKAAYLSMLLINKLDDLQHVDYAQLLRELASNYRWSTEDDYKIALETIRTLWRSHLNAEYPEIQKDFEVVLLLDPKYRDHFLHQFQVFLLGSLIIDKLYDENWVRNFESTHGSKLENAWLAASTYHDFNYPVERWEGWITNFLEQSFHVSESSGAYHLHQDELKNEIVQLQLDKVVVRDEFLAKMIRLCNAIKCEFDDHFQRFILRRVVFDKNHAVIGALTFLEKFKYNSRLTESAVNEAAASILLHDEPNWLCFCGNIAAISNCSLEEQDICQTPLVPILKLDEKPLSFILVFCDAAQEWGRRGRGFDNEKPQLKAIQIDTEQILIHIAFEDQSSAKAKQEEIEEIAMFLDDDRFTIRIDSRQGATKAEITMSGT